VIALLFAAMSAEIGFLQESPWWLLAPAGIMVLAIVESRTPRTGGRR
jgi:hypothetical protein